jgi:arginyl-tRNA synthetase
VLPHKQIELRLQAAVRAVLPDANVSKIFVRPCPNPKFGDYQCSALISLAKERGMNPRELAGRVATEYTKIWHKDPVDFEIGILFEIAGSGFFNFRINEFAVSHELERAIQGEHFFFLKTERPRTAVIDFSSPNVAKPMHVGHIRSTILGDCLARTLRLLGHRVITDNHIGDWGTQFGMLLYGWKREDLQNQVAFRAALNADPLGVMERLYKKISAECQSNPEVLNNCREELVKLQQFGSGPENRNIWRIMVDWSGHQFAKTYSRLGVKFDHSLGESFYNDRLQPLVDEFLATGIARESEGAIAIFFDDNPQLKAHPALIRKSDGGFNYTTTDLATLAYRMETWQPDEIIYVTDGRQQLHFQQLFAAFRKWQSAIGNRQSAIKLAHVWFGSILGEDGKPFKTRSGETVKLADLLDEAEERAFKIVTEKSSELPESQRREIARVIGLGAVKYADLLPNRQSDYIFSWDKMLALQGNTAPYLQYAYARIRSIFRKAETESAIRNPQSAIALAAPEEIALAKHLLNFGLTLEAVAEEYRPNFLCNYLFDLAGKFTAFYENCPVLKADDATRASRLALCDLTARVLKQGLETLGIETVEQM